MKAQVKGLLSFFILIAITSRVFSQTWEESNDPNNLCSGSYTGYKATLDCRGYVYCNEGYLMGGDVIPCWPNQLFDEANAVCTTWQSVTESLGDDISWKCPDFDGSLMAPDDKDTNANPQLFFCGTSTFNAKSVCEPCPGGIRTECSDPSHNCYAGITGCPVNSNPVPTPAELDIVTEPTPPPVTPKPTPNPATPQLTPVPTESSVGNELTTTTPTNANNGDHTDSFYLHGKLRTSYYCGFSWDLVIKTCNMAHPCPSGLNNECPMGQTCFPDTPCNELQTPPPTPKPTGKPTSITQATYYCGPDWNWVVNHCSEAIPCPYADPVGVCPDGHRCIADTPCDKYELAGPNSQNPTPIPTPNPTFPPVEGDDPEKRYCGLNWSDVTENCLTAIPCPGGVALNVCPDGMNCIAETPCKDQEYLDWLRVKQQQVAAELAEAEASGLSTTTDEGNEYCMNDDDCDSGLMCNKGYCSECLDDGTGCSMEQVCKPATCDEVQISGPKQCFSINDLDKVCRETFNDARAVCVIDVMSCEVQMSGSDQEGTQTIATGSSETENANLLTMYENPEGNTYFCGDDYYAIKSKCLESRPCPGGFASTFCEGSQGCFSVLECQTEYNALVSSISFTSDGENNSSSTTDTPTTNLTKSPSTSSSAPTITSPTNGPLSEEVPSKLVSVSPTLRPVSSAPTTTSPTNGPSSQEVPSEPASPTLRPVSSAPTQGNKNYCGVSWSAHSEDCTNARPCPRGDECETGETCFSDSPCSALNSELEDSNIKHICGTEWNTLVNQCKTATPCPKGDECASGEICYRNFVCNPPQVNGQLAGAFDASVQNGTSQVVVNGDVSLSDEMAESGDVHEEFSSTSDSVSSSTTSTTINRESVAEISQNEEASVDVADNAPEEILPTSLEYCNLCGSAGLFDYNSEVNFDGFDSVDEMPCGELMWVFARKNVYDGSSECLANRAQYFDDCCIVTPQDACSICPEGHEVYLDRKTNYLGTKTDCSRVANLYSTRFDESSEECRDGQTTHALECCFRPCSMCEDMQPNWDASVYFSGEDLKCNEFDLLFREESVTKESPRCQMSRDLYSEECCLQSLNSPCDVCNTQVSGKHLTSSTEVSYEGDMTTCLAVYTHLLSSVEKDTDTCARAQRDLVEQCCESVGEGHSNSSYDRAPEIAENHLPTPMPAPTEDSLSAQWYAGNIHKQPSASSKISFGIYTLIAAGLLLMEFDRFL